MLGKKTKTEQPALERTDEQRPVQPTFPVINMPAPPAKETVCVVCGHVNRGETLICEMCSNYLFD